MAVLTVVSLAGRDVSAALELASFQLLERIVTASAKTAEETRLPTVL